MIRHNSMPSIPIHSCRDSFFLRKAIDVSIVIVPATRAVHVSRHSRHILDDSSILPSLKLEIIGFGVALVAHLGSKLRMFASCLHYEFCLMERAAERFLDVDVLPLIQSQHHEREVRVVWNCPDYSLEIFAAFVEHLTEVLELFYVRVSCEDLLALRAVQIDIAKSHDIYHAGFFELLDDLFAPVSDSDKRNFNFLPLRFIRFRGRSRFSRFSGFSRFLLILRDFVSQNLARSNCKPSRSHGHGF